MKTERDFESGSKTKPIEWLLDAPKAYRNMTVRLVPTAASRSVYRDMKSTRGRELLEASVRYIESVPSGETVLVIGYKGWFKMKGVDETNLELALRKRLKPADSKRVAYLAYGRHTATNDYKEVKHVLLMGLNFIPRAVGHATSGAALELNLKNEQPTPEQIHDVQRGLLMDSTLQAVLRGNARNGVGGDCGTMEAVVFQTKLVGLAEDEYRRCFPEVVLVHDRVIMPEKKLGGRLDELAAIVNRRLEAGETEMTNPSLYEELRMAQGNFATMVKRSEWLSYVMSLGIRPQRLRGKVSGLRVITE